MQHKVIFGVYMHEIKYLPFTIKFSIILIFFDIYFLYRLRKLFLQREFPYKIFKILFVISYLMIIISVYNVWVQFNSELTTSFKNNLFIIKDLWYLPKILIVPIMLVYDFMILIKCYDKWLKGFVGMIYQIKYIINNVLRIPINLISKNKYEPLLASNNKLNMELNISNPSIEDNTIKNQVIVIEKQEKIDNKRRKVIQNITWSAAGIPFLILGSISG